MWRWSICRPPRTTASASARSMLPSGLVHVLVTHLHRECVACKVFFVLPGTAASATGLEGLEWRRIMGHAGRGRNTTLCSTLLLLCLALNKLRVSRKVR